jgi:hypothetical protein
MTDVLTNTVNQKWFTDTQIWADNRYVNSSGRPANFFMSGMDLLGGQYALPQEKSYLDHLVSVGPLAGNLI